jgi:hypothetical protein
MKIQKKEKLRIAKILGYLDGRLERRSPLSKKIADKIVETIVRFGWVTDCGEYLDKQFKQTAYAAYSRSCAIRGC